MPNTLHPQEQQYVITENMPPHHMLTWALGTVVVERGMRALDLGCGAGRDTRALVMAGFDEVVAMDHFPVAEAYVRKHIPPENQPTVTFVAGDYQSEYPDGPFNLINAQLTLSHNPPETFSRVMTLTRQRLVPGGVFVGNFFGDGHAYNQPGAPFTFLTRQEAVDLFANAEHIHLLEHYGEGPAPYADPSERWHWFDMFVRSKVRYGRRSQYIPAHGVQD